MMRLAMLLLALVAWQSAATPYRYQRVGSAKSVAAQVTPGYALIGGGTDLDAAFVWLCQHSGNGDFLIVRASGTDAYNPYVETLCPSENSVATLILPSRAAAEDPFAARTIAQASAIFLAGGDQANYINYWMGTPVERAMNAAIARGVPVGGTSAGLAVLGEYAYSAQHDLPDGPDLSGKRALANPDDRQVVIVHGFLRIAPLRGIITDSHFHNRDRMGRLVAFLERTRGIRGVGIDQETALLVEKTGEARAAGKGSVYLLDRGGAGTGDEVIALKAGDRFDLKRWRGDGERYGLRWGSGGFIGRVY